MEQQVTQTATEVTVIGAGLTGLTTAYWLSRKGISVHVVETRECTGGQIKTNHNNEFIFETGPTTGSVSTPEVAELMSDLAITSGGRCQLETAPDAAKRRLIWKGDRFHDLPAGPLGGLTTPFEAVERLQQQYPGLVVAGNLRDGIGMAHRITQATMIANHIININK